MAPKLQIRCDEHRVVPCDRLSRVPTRPVASVDVVCGLWVRRQCSRCAMLVLAVLVECVMSFAMAKDLTCTAALFVNLVLHLINRCAYVVLNNGCGIYNYGLQAVVGTCPTCYCAAAGAGGALVAILGHSAKQLVLVVLVLRDCVTCVTLQNYPR